MLVKMAKLFAVFWMAGNLIGCSSTPEQIPDCKIPTPMAEIGYAVSVPDSPSEVAETSDGAVFDLDGMLQFERIRQAGLANNKVAEENALALEARNDEVNALIECARYQNVWIQVHNEDLKDEKREHFIDNLLHRGLIALGILAVAL